MNEERKAVGRIALDGIGPGEFINFVIGCQEHLDFAEWNITDDLFTVDYFDLEEVIAYLDGEGIEYEVYPFADYPELAPKTD